MRFRISRRTKRRLAKRANYNYFLRLLIFKVWFRVVFLGMVLLIAFLALFLPKIWTATPARFEPSVKVSGVDLAQAWSMRHKAVQAMNARNLEQAHYAWLGAIANNPADAGALRGLLTNLLSGPSPDPEFTRAGVRQGRWLLQLTRTNHADLELFAEFLRISQEPGQVIALLQPMADRLTTREQALYLKCLFQLRQFPEFLSYWQKARADQLTDSELPLYHAAVVAGWGSPTQAAQDKLSAAATTPSPRQALANHLLLIVSAKRGELSQCEVSLQALKELHQDHIEDHATYWQALAQAGQAQAAQQLAANYPGRPASAADLLALTDAYRQIGLRAQAILCFKSFAPKFPAAESVWVQYAALLAESSHWQDLQELAVQIRSEDWSGEALAGYAYFLEGWAEHHLARRALAEEAFRKMNQLWTGSSRLGFSAATTLNELGYFDAARELLLRFEQDLKNQPDYWGALFNAASGSGDTAFMLKAANREFTLGSHDNIQVASHYATALLANRQQDELAVQLTDQVLKADPSAPRARIEHSLALIRTHHAQEAEPMLLQIQENSLPPKDKHLLHLAWFELHYSLKQYDQAWEAHDRIDEHLMSPTDANWLRECKGHMPARS